MMRAILKTNLLLMNSMLFDAVDMEGSPKTATAHATELPAPSTPTAYHTGASIQTDLDEAT